MISQQQWLHETCTERNYKKLYAVGMEISRDDPRLREFLPDAIQDVFLLLCKKWNLLIQHTAIQGWLVAALKLRLGDLRKQIRNTSQSVSFSLDDDKRIAERMKVEASISLSRQTIFRLMEERLAEIEASIGTNDMRILEAYYNAPDSRAEIAKSHGLSAAALRKKVNRTCKKIRAHDIAIAIPLCFLSQR